MSEETSHKPESKTTTYANALEWKQQVVTELFDCLHAFVQADAKITVNSADPSIPHFISSVKSLYLICRDKVDYIPEAKREPFTKLVEGFDEVLLNPFLKDGIRESYKKSLSAFVLLRSILEELEYTKVERESVKVTPEMINRKTAKDRLRLMG